jgi:hypothetical protein
MYQPTIQGGLAARMPKPKTIDLEQVRRMAACGCTDREIAFILGVSENLLRRKARQALDQGRAQLQKSLRRKQLEMARRGSVPMLIWLGKQYLGQRDRQDILQTQRTVEIVEQVVWPEDPQEASQNDPRQGSQDEAHVG